MPTIHHRPDPDIARDIIEALKRDLPLSWERLKATVDDGLVTLEGDVEWQYQRESAEKAVWHVRGVKGVVNDIKIPTIEIKRKIEEALRRAAEIDASRISVETNGSEVILRGTVRVTPQDWINHSEMEQLS